MVGHLRKRAHTDQDIVEVRKSHYPLDPKVGDQDHKDLGKDPWGRCNARTEGRKLRSAPPVAKVEEPAQVRSPSVGRLLEGPKRIGNPPLCSPSLGEVHPWG